MKWLNNVTCGYGFLLQIDAAELDDLPLALFVAVSAVSIELVIPLIWNFLECGIFPRGWKKVKIVEIRKKDICLRCDNWRVICVLQKQQLKLSWKTSWNDLNAYSTEDRMVFFKPPALTVSAFCGSFWGSKGIWNHQLPCPWWTFTFWQHGEECAGNVLRRRSMSEKLVAIIDYDSAKRHLLHRDKILEEYYV